MSQTDEIVQQVMGHLEGKKLTHFEMCEGGDEHPPHITFVFGEIELEIHMVEGGLAILMAKAVPSFEPGVTDQRDIHDIHGATGGVQ